ncbi:hypothetical protein [Megamonas funiformis]|jgi:hypothetical protein|uniref:hypothetical protein n=1 Tax=Megamonas funiformis TaxID=437897 RepID=UPI00241DD205|nr:hypothetical protein [Megamonas funiformis]
MKNTNIIQMESLFNETVRKESREDIVDKVFKAYKSENKTVERRIRIPVDLDFIIKTEKINCEKLLEKAVRDYLVLKY